MIDVAIVGATGMVGETILEILESRNFPVNELYLLASSSSVGINKEFNGRTISVSDVADFDFSKAQIAFFSAGADVSKEFVPIAASAGCTVIDNTSAFRYDDNVPLVVPEINLSSLENNNSNIIANPNCSTIQMLIAVYPIYKLFGIKRINVATYQSVSGAGQKGITELVTQLGELLNGRGSDPSVFEKQIAFNALPVIDVLQENMFSKEEMKMVWETQKILDDDNIQVNPTAVRVPVLYGHSEAIHVETLLPVDIDKLKEHYKNYKGVKLLDSDYPTAHDIIEDDNILVGRLRKDLFLDNGVNLWAVGDNVRKGAALNSVQIAEEVIKNYLYNKSNVTEYV